MTSQEDNKDTSGCQEELMREMKQRLTEADFYEDGMTLDQMRGIINAIDESKKNAEESSAHQIAQSRTPSVSPPIEGPVNISPPETPNENNTEAPRMSYSNAAKSNKPPTGNVGPERRENTEGNSTLDPTNRTPSKEYKSLPKVAVKEHWDKKDQRRKKLNLDPLKVTLNENDVPLLQPERPLVVESEPFSFCNDLKNSKFTPKELVQKVSDYLEEVRDEWISHIRIEAVESEFQWGSPIKVGSRNFNLDKKSVTSSDPEVVEPVRESRNRASKRKAASLIASINNVSDSDGEPDDEFSLLKKRKSQQEGRNATAGGSDVQMDVDEPKPSEMPSTSSSFASVTRIEVSEDDEEIFEPRDRSKSPTFFQPRRIVPPNPGTNKARRGRGRGGKGSFNGPRAKKSTEDANKTPVREASPSKKPSPPEICLDNDDVEFDDLSKPTDIKMLKLPMQERTNLAKQRLEDIKNQEKQRIEVKKFYESRSEEEKRKQREELVKKRLLEEEKARRLAKEKEEKENEKKKKWNTILNESVKQKKEKPKGLTDEEVRKRLEEDDVVVCDDQPSVHTIGSTSENRVPCPICSKNFPESDIENHASECDQFEFVEEDTSSPVIGTRRRRNNANKQKCNICDKYETYDQNDYIEHIQICIEQDRNRKTSMVSVNEVEYQGQFPAGRRNFSPKGRRYN